MRSVADGLQVRQLDVGVYLQPLHQGISCHCEFSLPYDPDDPPRQKRIGTSSPEASEELLKNEPSSLGLTVSGQI